MPILPRQLLCRLATQAVESKLLVSGIHSFPTFSATIMVRLVGIADVVGSNPSTQCTFIILVTYSINSSVFWIVVGQFEQ